MIVFGRLVLNRWRMFHAEEGNERDKGMTIIEILIVIALIGTIMTIVIVNVLRQAEEARKDLALTSEGMLSQSLVEYRLHNGRVPSTEEGLKALVSKPESAKNWRGPYLDEDKLLDPWRQEYSYESGDGRQYKIHSAGPDGVPGNEDDITYPKKGSSASE